MLKMCKEIGGEDFPRVRQCAAFPQLNSKTQLTRSITLRKVRVTRTGSRTGCLIVHAVRLANCRTGAISSRKGNGEKVLGVKLGLISPCVDRIIAAPRMNGDVLDRQGL